MRHQTTATALLGLFLLALGAVPARAATPDRAADIRKTAELLLRTEAGPEGNVQKALAHLVEIAGAIAGEGRLAPTAKAKLDAALVQAAKGPLLDPAAVTAVGDAYAAVNGGRAFTFPQTVKSIEGAKALLRQLSEDSVKALQGGRSEEAARDLLACVLAFITPMEASL